jgi:hypothetical protein
MNIKGSLYLGLGIAVFSVIIVVAVTPGTTGKIIPLVILGITALVLFRFLGPLLSQQKLAQTGAPAQATILSVWDTGVTINHNPQVGVRLEVRAADGSPA